MSAPENDPEPGPEDLAAPPKRRWRWRIAGFPVAVLAGLGTGAYLLLPKIVPPSALGVDALQVIVPDTRCGQTGLPDTLDVLVWNAYKALRPGWSDGYAELADGAELVLMQEAWIETDPATCTMRKALSEQPGFGWHLAISWIDRDKGDAQSGVATGGCAPAIEQMEVRAPALEVGFLSPKVALVTRYRLAGEDATLLVANIHSLLLVGDKAYEKQLQNLEAHLRDHDGPLLLAGDFNAWNGARTARMRALAARLDLTEVDFPGPEQRLSQFGYPLDYAFVRGYSISAASVPKVATSDHNPLRFRLTRAR